MPVINVVRWLIPTCAFTLLLLWSNSAILGATYYVSQSSGSDEATGTAAAADGQAGPWKTLAKASSIKLAAGDQLLLKRGDTWNELLKPQGSGTPDAPILIGAYGEGAKPIIDREDYNEDRSGIELNNQGGIKIVGLEFNRCMTGIYAEFADEAPTQEFLWIEDCYFHDSLKYQPYQDYPKRKIGLGICLFSFERDKRIVLADITVKNCTFRRLASGIWTNSPDNFNKGASFVYNFANLTLDGCLFEEGYQWQMGIRGVDGGLVRNCVTHDVGENFRSFNGVAGAMFFRCRKWVFEDSEWGHISIGLGSGDGEAFDFEGNCDDMTMRRCVFHDTDGPGFLLCCYASDGNPHSKLVMEDCVINGKSKRPIGLPRCAIVNTTDWNESTWKNCRFYLSPGEALMRVMDPEKDKRTAFENCLIHDLSSACSTAKVAGKVRVSSAEGQVASIQDDDAATAWTADAAEGQWVELDFGKDVLVNEFKLKEDASSSITRFAIELWDVKSSSWRSCFHGATIGEEFVAPIVGRTTTKVRLQLLRTKDGKPAIAEFAAYNNTTGDVLNMERGKAAPDRIGK